MKIESMKDLLKIESPEILILQETKIERESLLYLSIMNWKRKGGKAINARGTARGLAMVWNED
jgi:hypothetical protein